MNVISAKRQATREEIKRRIVAEGSTDILVDHSDARDGSNELQQAYGKGDNSNERAETLRLALNRMRLEDSKKQSQTAGRVIRKLLERWRNAPTISGHKSITVEGLDSVIRTVEDGLAFDKFFAKENYRLPDLYRKAIESLDVTISGASFGSKPVGLVVPNSPLATLSSNTLIQVPLEPGEAQATAVMYSVPTSGALSQLVQPTDANVSLTNVSTPATGPTVTERGAGLLTSFSAEKKIPNLDESILLGLQLSYLNDKDVVAFGANGACESVSTGSLAGVVYPSGITSEASITSSNTFTASMIANGVGKILGNNYSFGGLVCIVSPQQFMALLQDSAVTKIIENQNPELLNSGVIESLYGVEIRASPFLATGNGSPTTVTTYHSYLYKKGQSILQATSRNILIETFRDIKVNGTYWKSHYDLSASVIAPLSVCRLVSA